MNVVLEDDGTPTLFTTFVLTVVVLNQNDAPYITNGQIFTVNENIPVKTNVGTPIQWKDEDSSSKYFFFFLFFFSFSF